MRLLTVLLMTAGLLLPDCSAFAVCGRPAAPQTKTCCASMTASLSCCCCSTCEETARPAGPAAVQASGAEQVALPVAAGPCSAPAPLVLPLCTTCPAEPGAPATPLFLLNASFLN